MSPREPTLYDLERICEDLRETMVPLAASVQRIELDVTRLDERVSNHLKFAAWAAGFISTIVSAATVALVRWLFDGRK